jgi:ABC-2 type transport system permease protein
VSQPATLTWLAGHELRLGWRDWVALMTAGRRNRARTVAVALIIFAAFMHLFAYWIVAGYADATVASDTATLVGVTGTLVLSWSLLLSQAMESVTRAFYARSDLDLILTSPVSARKVFSVRMGRIAGAAVIVAVLLAAPFINVLAMRGGARWLAAYGVVAGMGAVAAAAALALTIALFRLVGAKRTRLIAQIVAAVIGAAFVIGLQIAAIFSSGSISRFAALQSQWMLSHAPDTGSAFWWPAHAVLGDPRALVAVVAISFAVLGIAIALFSGRFGDHAMAAAGVGSAVVRQRRWRLAFRRRSAARVLRQKEWTLLARDPWLVSQTLMQILYLLPPALLLWVTFRDATGSYVILIPVVVMAAGQLAGGLAWLSISGEDAPDLIASAPIAPSRVLRAKIEAVIGMIALVFAPIVAVLAFEAPFAAFVSALGILTAAAAATLIQICFRTQARRSQFRRRQTSSRIATFAEAFSSIAWAATSALAAAGTWMALGPALIAVGILVGVRVISPKPQA